MILTLIQQITSEFLLNAQSYVKPMHACTHIHPKKKTKWDRMKSTGERTGLEPEKGHAII